MAKSLKGHQNIAYWRDQFIKSLGHEGKSLNTLKNYKTDLDVFIKYLAGKTAESYDLGGFGLEQVKEYGGHLDVIYTSDNSKRRRVQTLRKFFDYLLLQELVTGNPVRKLPTSPKKLDPPKPNPHHEVMKLWNYLKNQADDELNLDTVMAKRNLVIVMLIYGSALKVSDLEKLKRPHIGKTRVTVNHPKRDPYSVPLCACFHEYYDDYLSSLKTFLSGSGKRIDHVLFNANAHAVISGKLTARGIELLFEEWSKQLDFEMTAKSLRQASVTNWVNQAHKDNLIKEWMGVAPSYSLKMYRDISENFQYKELS